MRETIPSTANKGRCRAGRVASLVFVNRLFLRVRVSKTASPRDGGDAGGLCRPKPSAAVRCQTRLPRICRARFSASGGRRPLSFVSARKAGEAGRKLREGGGRFCEFGTTPRTINRPRGLRLFSRRLGLNEDAARTLRAGRENRSPVHWGRGGTMTVARVDDGRGAFGV